MNASYKLYPQTGNRELKTLKTGDFFELKGDIYLILRMPKLDEPVQQAKVWSINKNRMEDKPVDSKVFELEVDIKLHYVYQPEV